MEFTYKFIETEETFEAFRSLLRSSSLPADDLNYKKDLLIGYYEGNILVGTGGLEVYGDHGLLRSLSVKFGIRGRSVGTNITEYLLDEAKRRGLKGVYLLTETCPWLLREKRLQGCSQNGCS